MKGSSYLLISGLIFLCSCSSLFVSKSENSRSLASSNAKSSNLISNVADLRNALTHANDGDELSLASVVFDFTNEPTLIISKKIKLNGNSAHFISHSKPLPLIQITAPNVTLRNLKIEGDEKETREAEIRELMKTVGSKATYKFPIIRGVEISAKDVIIEDCELFGWSHAAIAILSNASAIIRRNKIHHNQRESLGYGVVLEDASIALISENDFDYNRHSIAGTGHSGQSYEASYNTFGPHHIDSTLDMHGGKDRGDGTNIAGHTVYIHHNLIKANTVPAFVFRGIPEDRVIFEKNKTAHASIDEAVTFPASYGFHIWNIPFSHLIQSGNNFNSGPF